MLGDTLCSLGLWRETESQLSHLGNEGNVGTRAAYAGNADARASYGHWRTLYVSSLVERWHSNELGADRLDWKPIFPDVLC